MVKNAENNKSFSSTTSYLKRRFSQNDLNEDECNNEGQNQASKITIPPSTSQTKTQHSSQSNLSNPFLDNSLATMPNPSSTVPSTQSHQPTHTRSLSGASSLTNQFSDLTSNFSLKNNPITSSSSPAKNVSAFLSRATSITNSVTSNVAEVAGRISSGIKDISGRSKILLVIDDYQIDWSKYFRGKRIFGDYDIRVEQGEFRDLTLYSHCEQGTICGFITTERGVHKVARQFKPDFLLVRQHVKDNQDDFTNLILGLKYSNLNSINSLHSIYNFIDRPLVYAQLIYIQNMLGKENFPLIEQTFYPSYKEMLNNPPKFPCVIKMGHSHGGLGKLRAESLAHFQELLSVLACTNGYLTIEPYIDAKCDIHIQKIGNNYKAFMRKSISGDWKSNIGSAILEQCQVTEKYRKWADEVSKLFGGLDLLTIEIVETKDNKEFIYEATGSQMTLMGETQEEDRRLISDLIIIKMQQAFTSHGGQLTTRSSFSKEDNSSMIHNNPQSQIAPETPKPTSQHQSFLKRMGSISGSISNTIDRTLGSNNSSNASTNRLNSTGSTDSANSNGQSLPEHLQQHITDKVDKTTQQIRDLFKRNPQAGNEQEQANVTSGEPDSEDTMKNLRKTFAGIFGDN